MTAWTDHVKKTFEAGRKKDEKYSYKQAMSDAKSTYKKATPVKGKGKVEVVEEEPTMPKKRGRKKKVVESDE